MSISLGQHVVKVDSFVGGTTTNPTASPTNNGSTFLIFCASTHAGLSFSDNMGNNYTPNLVSVAYNGTFRKAYASYVQNGVGGSGHTFSCSGGTSDSIILFGVELPGAALSGGADQTTTPTTGSSVGVSVQPITPVANNALVLNFVAQLAGTATSSGAPWGLVDTGDETSFGTAAALSYSLVASPTAVNDVLTFSGNATYAAFSYSFAPSGGILTPVSRLFHSPKAFHVG